MVVSLGLGLGVKVELGQFGRRGVLDDGLVVFYHVVCTSCGVGKGDAFIEYDGRTCDGPLNKTPILFPTLYFLGRS